MMQENNIIVSIETSEQSSIKLLHNRVMASNTHVAALDSYMTGVSFLNIIKFMDHDTKKLEETKKEFNPENLKIFANKAALITQSQEESKQEEK